MENESQDRVWKLLNESRKVEVDPFFSRNCVREVRLQETGSRKTGLFARFQQTLHERLAIPQIVGGAFAIAVTAAVVTALMNHEGSPTNASSPPIASSPIVETADAPLIAHTEPIASSIEEQAEAVESVYAEMDAYGELLAASDVKSFGDKDIERLLFY